MNQDVIPYREISLVGLAALGVFAGLSIGTYSPMDAAFSYSSDSGTVQNLVGRTGAWFADLALTLFGWVAWLLPAIFVWLGWRLVRDRGETSPRLVVALRLTGWLLVVMSTCVLMQIHFLAGVALPAGTGGIVGRALAEVLVAGLGWVGATLLAITGLLIGLQAAAGFSWLMVAEHTGRALHRVSRWAVARYDRTVETWRERRDAAEMRARTEARAAAVEAPVQKKPAAAQQPAKRSPLSLPKIQTPAPPVRKKAQQRTLFGGTVEGLPDMELLDNKDTDEQFGFSPESLEAMSRLLEIKLQDFGVVAEVVSVLPGPVVTRFEIQPAAGVKVQKISALAKDLAR